MRRARAVVEGMVQGVGFRASCAAEARSRGVAGWVRNRSDGRVEAVFEGRADAVEAMVRWCRQGPAWAEVKAVEVTDEEPAGESAFRVR